MRAQRYVKKPGITSSPAFAVGIVAVLLLVVLYVINRERPAPPSPAPPSPAQTNATPVHDDSSFATTTQPKTSSAIAKPTPPPPPPSATPLPAPIAPVMAPPPAATTTALTVDEKDTTPAPPRVTTPVEREETVAAGESPPPVSETPSKAESPKKKTSPPPATALSLSFDEVKGFLTAARAANVASETAGGLAVRAALIPDTLTFRAAEKAEQLFKKGVAEKKVLAEVKSYFALRRQAEGGKPLLEVTVSPAQGWVLFMTPAGLAKSFKARFDDATIACDVTALTPLPAASKWKMWFGKIAGSNEPKMVSLHYLTKPLTLHAAVRDRWPAGKNLTLSVLNFCHVRGKPRGPQDLEGVNVGMQQIHKADVESFKTQAEVVFTRHTNREVDPPAAFKALLAK